MPGADCESDHNPVVVTVKSRLQRNRKFKSTIKWNINKFKNSENKDTYKQKPEKQLQDRKVGEEIDVDGMWNKLKENLEIVAEEICEKFVFSLADVTPTAHGQLPSCYFLGA